MATTDFAKMANSYVNDLASFPSPELFQAASSIVLALQECDDELKAEAITLFQQLNSGTLDEGETTSTIALLSEILFPNADHRGLPGLDLEEAERIAPAVSAEAPDLLRRMDEEESVFADHLRRHMEAKGVTQAQLAEKVGVGQSAIAMMLQRNCRPQKRTVRKLADALGAAPRDLWPNY